MVSKLSGCLEKTRGQLKTLILSIPLSFSVIENLSYGKIYEELLWSFVVAADLCCWSGTRGTNTKHSNLNRLPRKMKEREIWRQCRCSHEGPVFSRSRVKLPIVEHFHNLIFYSILPLLLVPYPAIIGWYYHAPE